MERDDPWDENDGEELEAEIMRADHAFGADLRERLKQRRSPVRASIKRSPKSDPKRGPSIRRSKLSTTVRRISRASSSWKVSL